MSIDKININMHRHTRYIPNCDVPLFCGNIYMR